MPCVRFSCGDESFHAHGRWLLLGCDSRNIVYDHNTHYRILHIKTNLHDYRRLETSPFGNRERREETLNDLFQVFDQSFRDLAPSAPLRYWKDRSIARGSCNERAHYCDTFSVLSWTPSAPASGPVPEAVADGARDVGERESRGTNAARELQIRRAEALPLWSSFRGIGACAATQPPTT